MGIITSIDGLMRTLPGLRLGIPEPAEVLVTGLPALDALLPGNGFARGAVHETLGHEQPPSLILPLLTGKASRGWIVWCDPDRTFYPPAAAALELSLERILILRPSNPIDLFWAVTECLRCRGVEMCVAPLRRLSPLQARRLQLAAEQGGGIGWIVRPAQDLSRPYAAATRWLVQPAAAGKASAAVGKASAAGEKNVQRWNARLVHGHGGRVGQSVLLELNRETHHVRAVEAMADRPDQTQAAILSA